MILLIAIVIFSICAAIVYIILCKDFKNADNNKAKLVSLCRENFESAEELCAYLNNANLNVIFEKQSAPVIRAKNANANWGGVILGGTGTRGTARGQMNMVLLASEVADVDKYLKSCESRF